MNRKIINFALSAVILCLLCGCNEESVPAEITGANVSETAAVSTTVPESSETVSERASVSFAPAETEPEKTEAAPSETAEAAVLAENQLDYSGRDFYLLMEFKGAESLQYYPRAAKLPSYRDDDFVVHSKFTITNLSERDFDFIPQKMVLYGRNNRDSGFMIPINARDTGLAASDGYYTVEAGETVSFDVDFVGDEVCVDYAYKIMYKAVGFREPNNVDPDELNNVSAAEFEITKRSAVKNAVRAGKDFQKEKSSSPSELVPREGEYSVLTHKNSYCFTAEPIVDGRYIKVVLRVQCLTGEPEIFKPYRFRLYRTADDYSSAYRWEFDLLLAGGTTPEVKNDLEGVSGTLYDTPWELAVRSDGSAEYTMYFNSAVYEPSEYYKFCYDGEKGEDVFECIINME
ncbi:MAG: hypothetical protein K2K34_05670 [Oscillospiraceae bacterium]|nr:hypothetical protein [Oscillospiraceae bacterium]